MFVSGNPTSNKKLAQIDTEYVFFLDIKKMYISKNLNFFRFNSIFDFLSTGIWKSGNTAEIDPNKFLESVSMYLQSVCSNVHPSVSQVSLSGDLSLNVTSDVNTCSTMMKCSVKEKCYTVNDEPVILSQSTITSSDICPKIEIDNAESIDEEVLDDVNDTDTSVVNSHSQTNCHQQEVLSLNQAMDNEDNHTDALSFAFVLKEEPI